MKLTESEINYMVTESVKRILGEGQETGQPAKYIMLYNGMPYPFNSIEEAAVKFFGFKVVPDENGTSWDVIINGRSTAHYRRDEFGDGYTKEEVIKDQLIPMQFMLKNTYTNLHWYQLIK